MLLNPAQIIELLALEPLPIEGGYYRQSYLAADHIPESALPGRYPGAWPICSAIYYLLFGELFSALHRLSADEIYHHYLGDPVEMLILYPDGESRRIVGGADLAAGQCVQWVVPAGTWQGSRLLPGGSLALMGTTMAPAYSPEAFELGERSELLRNYPTEKDLILALTRENQNR